MAEKPTYHVASFSGGKDSTAMTLRLIELGEPLDEVVFCDTTMEFPAMLRHVEKVRQVVEAAGIKFTTLRDDLTFEEWLLDYTPERKNPALKGLQGKSWPGPMTRWCTQRLKERVIKRHLKNLRDQYTVVQLIGIAADEGHRLDRKQQQEGNKRFPLVEWGWTEADAMAYCRERGYDWEGLYDLFNRVSCWCCPLQPLAEVKKLWKHFPDLWERLGKLDAQTWRDFMPRGWSVERLERRFVFEETLEAKGYSIKNQQFFADLKRLLAGETNIDNILKEREESKT